MKIKSENNFKDDVAYLENSNYRKIFGKTFKNQKNLPWNRGILKISAGELTIYRLFASGNNYGITQSEIGLSKLSLTILGIETKDDIDIKIQKGNKFNFYWDHPEHYQRVAFKISLVSLFISSVSLAVSLIGMITT